MKKKYEKSWMEKWLDSSLKGPIVTKEQQRTWGLNKFVKLKLKQIKKQ